MEVEYVSFRTDLAKPKRDAEVDIANFTSALRRILIEFRTDKKGAPGRHSEMIDHVVASGNNAKRSVLLFLVESGVLYCRKRQYLVNRDAMSDMSLSMNAVCGLNNDSVQKAYVAFCAWKKAKQ